MAKIKPNTAKNKTSKKYCSECGYRGRGDNHYEGDHHKYGKGKVPVKR